MSHASDSAQIPTAVEEPQQNLPQTHTYPLQSLNSSVIIRQIPSEGISFQIWPAANTFVALLNSLPNSLSPLFPNNRRLRILELGSGTGLVGIAAAALLGASVTVTDLPHVIPNLAFNITANAAVLGIRGGAVEAAALAWGDAKDMEGIEKGEYDLVIGSDLVYHDHLYEPLIETLRFLLLGSGKKVEFLMAHLKRWKKESAFFKKAKKYFDVEVMYTDSPASGSRVGVTVYRFVRKG